MSERYARLFSLPENLYFVGAPVVIAAGALLKDNQTGKVLAQLKIQNISGKAIKAVTVAIVPLDTVGKPLGETVNYQYLDLNVVRDADFGQKIPIALPDAATRSVTISVSEVIFADNTVWSDSHTHWEPLSPPVTLESALRDHELVAQYRISNGDYCKYMFQQEKDLWRCPCGVINHADEQLCHRCRKEAAALASLNLDDLKAARDKRLESIKQRAAQEKAAMAMKKAKRNKLVIAMILIVVIAASAILYAYKAMQKRQAEAVNAEAYQSALAVIQGQYIDEESYPTFEQSYHAFMELGDYKDSAEIAQQLYNEMNVYETLEAETEYALVIDSSNAETLTDYIDDDFQYINPKEYLGDVLVTTIRFISPYIGEWEYISGDPSILSLGSGEEQRSLNISSNVSLFFTASDDNTEIKLIPLQVDGTSDIFGWMYSAEQNRTPFYNGETQRVIESMRSPNEDALFSDNSLYMEITSENVLQIFRTNSDGTISASCEYQRIPK